MGCFHEQPGVNSRCGGQEVGALLPNQLHRGCDAQIICPDLASAANERVHCEICRFLNHQPFPFSLVSHAEVEDEQSLPPLPKSFPSLRELQSPPVQQVCNNQPTNLSVYSNCMLDCLNVCGSCYNRSYEKPSVNV